LPGLRPDASGALFIGIDASMKHDSTALVCVKDDQLRDNLVLDFEATIEFYLAGFRAGTLA